MTLRHAIPLLGAALVAAFVTACRGNGTSLFVTVNQGARTITQLEFGVTQDGGVIAPPTLRPGTSGAALKNDQTVLILLPDSLGGSSVDLGVTGLDQGQSVAHVEQSIGIVRGKQVDVTVQLEPLPDGGLDGGNPADGGITDGGTDAGVTCGSFNCSAGCCDPDGGCVPYANESNSECGTGGVLCHVCTGLTCSTLNGTCI